MSNLDVPRVRLGVMAVVVVSLFAALFARLYYLQVLASPEFVVQAEQNQVRELRLDPIRGRILDRNGVELATNRLVGQVALDREILRELTIEETEQVYADVGAVLGLTPEEVAEEVADPANNPLLPVVLATGVDETVLTYLRERQLDFPGVIAEQVHERVYPLGPVAAHVIGYVGEIPAPQLEALEDEGYAPGDQIGKAGVEQTFETDLRGENGETRLEVDRRGAVVDVIGEPVAAEPGDDVVLTLDIRVQQVAEQALEDGLRSARNDAGEFNFWRPAPAGSVVVLDVTDGSVVAMVSAPTYDPNDFVGGISQATWDRLSALGAYAPLTNRAIQGQYAPGSTFKPITAIAGLESEVINLGTTIYDQGFFELATCEGEKCRWQNAGEAAYGAVDLNDSLIVSSDVFYYSVGASIQIDLPEGEDEAIQDVARRFGFGSASGVQLPSESAGRVPDRELKQAYYDAGVFEFGDWLVGDTINLAIGQGEMLATPMQIANAYATLATRGTRFQPNIASQVIDRVTGQVERQLTARVADEVELEVPAVEASWNTLHAGLIGAVNSYLGTAQEAFVGFPLGSYPVAGKTGTAQQFGRNPVTGNRKEDTAIFVGFAPAYEPRYVVAVVMEEGGFGGVAAAPVARRVFDALEELDRTGEVTIGSVDEAGAGGVLAGGEGAG